MKCIEKLSYNCNYKNIKFSNLAISKSKLPTQLQELELKKIYFIK